MTSLRRQLIGHGERVVLTMAVLFLCLHALPRAWRTLNTDFPNYYTAARLAHESYDTARMYEWQWIEREKDHRAINIRVIGLLPITPFSTLAILPMTRMSPLDAKHVWIFFNLAFLLPLAWMLRAMTSLSYRRIALAFLLSFPLYRNLLYGQFYIFLLLLLTAGCFSYWRGHRATAGGLVALAAACKVFPLLLFAVFLQRRDWRALAGGLITGLIAVVASIIFFGVHANQTWLQEILPWVTRGEGIGIYTPTASISGILHCLFLAEPQWNPHPWYNSPLTYALLAPILQMLILAPAILLIRKDSHDPQRLLLEWSTVLTASLAISTIPASYNFILMALPFCILASVLLQERLIRQLCLLVFAYIAIGFPFPVPAKPQGLALLLYVPRLPLMLLVLFFFYKILFRKSDERPIPLNWMQYAWITAMVCSTVAGTYTTWRVETAQRTEYAYRLPLREQGFLNANPQMSAGKLYYTAFTLSGYQLVNEDKQTIFSKNNGENTFDDLSYTVSSGKILVERASAKHSFIIDPLHPDHAIVQDARNPMLSANGNDLAFVHDVRGQGVLILHRRFLSNNTETQISPVGFNVYEATFHSPENYAFSATYGLSQPAIFITNASTSPIPKIIADARYPAISPDGKWLSYAHIDHGTWNLWVMDLNNSDSHRIANVPCNQIEPSWEEDSKHLLYATDCGRSIWFTAIARRRVIP